jgi:hypothetical protein
MVSTPLLPMLVAPEPLMVPLAQFNVPFTVRFPVPVTVLIAHREHKLSVGIDHARAVQRQDGTTEREGLRAAGTADREAADRWIKRIWNQHGGGAAVGDEGVVGGAGHLGRVPVGGGIPKTGAANPHEVSGVCASRRQRGREEDGLPFSNIGFHKQLVLYLNAPFHWLRCGTRTLCVRIGLAFGSPKSLLRNAQGLRPSGTTLREARRTARNRSRSRGSGIENLSKKTTRSDATRHSADYGLHHARAMGTFWQVLASA